MSSKVQLELTNTYLEGKIDKINAKEFHPNNFKHLWEIKKAIICENIIHKDENKELYLKFADIVHNKEFFRIDHVKALGKEYDILIFQSEKNIGKSYQMITRCNEIINRGGKVIIMRSIEEHIKAGLAEQLLSDHSDFYLGSDFKLYHKTLPNPKTGKGHLQVGIAMALTTAIKWKGGSFEDYEGIFFDEATDEHKLITTKEFRKFFISVANSIERRKENMTIEIYGNTDFSVSHPLFEVFEIDPEENLVYTTRKLPEAIKSTRILYINSRGLYPRGAKSSKFIGAIGDPRAAMDAFMNSVKNNTDRLVSIDLTYLTEPKFAILFRLNHKQEDLVWQLLVNRYVYKEPPSPDNGFNSGKAKAWYYIKIEKFEPAYLYGYKIYTDNNILHMLYRNYVRFMEDMSHYWLIIKSIIDGGRCIFIRRETEEILHKVLEKNTKNIETMGS